MIPKSKLIEKFKSLPDWNEPGGPIKMIGLAAPYHSMLSAMASRNGLTMSRYLPKLLRRAWQKELNTSVKLVKNHQTRSALIPDWQNPLPGHCPTIAVHPAYKRRLSQEAKRQGLTQSRYLMKILKERWDMEELL